MGTTRRAIKGGYGLYTDYQVLLGFNGYTTAAPYGVRLLSLSRTGPESRQALSAIRKHTVPVYAAGPGIAAGRHLVISEPCQHHIDSTRLQLGPIHKFDLEFEIEPINTYVFSAAWVATRGTHLSESHNLNWPRFVAGGSTNDTANVYSRQPYYPAGFIKSASSTRITTPCITLSRSTVKKRASYGLTLMGSYTYSASTAQQGCRYQAECALDYYSPGTVHQMTAAFSYQIPTFMRQNELSRRDLWGLGPWGHRNASTGGYGSVGDYNCNEYNFQSAGCYANYIGGGRCYRTARACTRPAEASLASPGWIRANSSGREKRWKAEFPPH